MFRNLLCKRIRISRTKTVIVWAALLLYPCVVLAQHGGHGGGASIGGGGLSGGGKPTGVDAKDDLKDFHRAMAVQATGQQISEYKSMVKSTAAAYAEMQALVEQLNKKDNGSPLGGRGTTLEQALEKARSENKNFLGGFSGPQKSGLKEVTKRLVKADSELAQRSQDLNQRIAETKGAAEPVAGSMQGLERALENFQSQQATLGREMGIGDTDSRDFTLNIAPVKYSITFQNQPIAITTSGEIFKSGVEEQNAFGLKLTEDISDLQENITGVLRAQLDKSERCGERIAIRDATLSQLGQASVAAVHLHFERWACLSGNNNEMAEGDGALEVKLTPTVGEDGTLRLASMIERVDAEGFLGDALHSGSLGSELRDKVAESVLAIVRQGADFKTVLPPAAQGSAVLSHVQFQSSGSGALMVLLEGKLQVSADKLPSLITAAKIGDAKEQPSPMGSVPR
jgi:hypothetical protein